MRTIVLSIGLCGLVWAGFRQPATAAETTPGDLVLRCHFVGLDQLLADTNAAKLKQLWSLPASAALRAQAGEQLARLPFLGVSNLLAKGAPDQAELFRPLFDDLFPSESYLEWRGPTRLPTEFVFAIRLSEERARLWSDNFKLALKNWKLGAISPDGDGWGFKRFDGRTTFAVARAGQWTVVGLGPAGMKLHSEIVKTIKANGRPVAPSPGHWLNADINLEQLKQWLPPLEPYRDLPVAHLSLSNSTEYVRTVMRLGFPQPHGWTGQPWAFPTNAIRDPLISFTVAQGIAPLLKPLKLFQDLKLDPQPNQITIWAQSQFPFLTSFAMPLENAGAQLSRMASVLPSLVLSNKWRTLPGTIGWSTNHHALVWQGLPMAMPNLAAIKDPGHEYVVGSLFQRMPGTNSPPPGLFEQLKGRTNLVYYDWEITEGRLKQWRPLYQLTDIMNGRAFASTNAPSQRWLQEAAPLLGNTITEITASSPTEMTLVRKSHSGFTGFELVSFMRWLDSPEFPLFSVAGQPRVPHPTKSKPAPKPAKR